MMLAPSELLALTGYVRHSAQIRWLKAHGWRFTVNALGEPVVAVAEFNRRLTGGRAAQQEPDFESLNDGPKANQGRTPPPPPVP